MRSNDPFGSGSAGRPDWIHAWEAVARLAAANPLARDGFAADRGAKSTGARSFRTAALPTQNRKQGRRRTDDGTPSAPPQRPAKADSGQLARAIAEIEKASAVLRRSEPALERWRPNSEICAEPRDYFSVWVLVGSIWISAIVLTAGASGAIVYLLG